MKPKNKTDVKNARKVRSVDWERWDVGLSPPALWRAGLAREPLSGGGNDSQARCVLRGIDKLVVNAHGPLTPEFTEEIQRATATVRHRGVVTPLRVGNRNWYVEVQRGRSYLVSEGGTVRVEVQGYNGLLVAEFPNRALWFAGPSAGLTALRSLVRRVVVGRTRLEVKQVDLAADMVGFDLVLGDCQRFEPRKGRPPKVRPCLGHDRELEGCQIGSRKSDRCGRVYGKLQELRQNRSKRDYLDLYPAGVEDVVRVEVCFRRDRILRVLGTAAPDRVLRCLRALWRDGVGSSGTHGWIRLVDESGKTCQRWRAVQGVTWPQFDGIQAAAPRQAPPAPLTPQLFGVVAAMAAQAGIRESLREVSRYAMRALLNEDRDRRESGRAGLLEVIQAKQGLR